MDEVYSQLVADEVALEEKNAELEQAMGESKRAYHQLREAHEALKSAQQQLLHSEKMASLGRLVAGVAHELNNPISFVLGNVHALLAGLDPDPQRLVVNFHTAFNLLLALTLIFLTGPVARLAVRLLPDDPKTQAAAAARFLDQAALEIPPLAIANAAREALRIGDIVEAMLAGLLVAMRTNDGRLARDIRRMDDDVDGLYAAVKLYLTQVSREALDEKEARRWTDIMSFTINMEHIGDIIERIVDGLEQKKISQGRSFSRAGMQEIEQLHARLMATLRLGLSVFLNGDLKSAQMLLAQKVQFRNLAHTFSAAHLDRLAGQTAQSIETSSLHLDIINDFKRVNSHICAIAYPILEAAGAIAPSGLREPLADRTPRTSL